MKTKVNRIMKTCTLVALLGIFGSFDLYGQTIAYSGAMLCEDGSVKTFGRNEDCQCGIGTAGGSYNSPQSTGISDAVAIATGAHHQLALLDDGTVLAWGYNYRGECGSSPNPPNYRICSPQEVNLPGCAVAVSAGTSFSLALLADKTVWAWGYDNYGQLGDAVGANTSYGTPVQVYGINNAVAISAGSAHGMALLEDGTVRTWGLGTNGELGDGTNVSKWTPVQVKTSSTTNLTDVVKIDAGAQHNIVLRDDGTVYTWGYAYEGRLGLGTLTFPPYYIAYATQSTDLSSGSGSVIDVAAGYHHSMTLKDNGATKVCGRNVYQALGICSGTNYYTPVSGPTISGAIDIRIPSTATYGQAIKSSGEMYAWGENDYGTAGVGSGSSLICPMQLVNDPPNYTTQCRAKASSTNHPQPCCVAIYEDGRTELEGSYSGGSMTYYSQNLALTGPITLTSGNHYLVDCDIVCESDASITVNSGARLYIQSGSHLYACGDMWQGIDAKTGSRIYVQSSSLIEDAEVAVDVEYGALYNINTAIFNKNYTHFYKHMSSGSVGGLTGDYVIAKSKFLCQTTASINSTPVHTTLLAPHAGQRTDVALLAVGVPKLLVGNTTAANANTIDNANWGIFDWTVGRVQVMHNTLNDIGNGGVYAVYGPGAGGETIDIVDNDFLRIHYPVYCYDNDHTVRTHINDNIINFDGMGTPPPTGMVGITYEEIAPASGGNLNYVDISGNTIYKAPTGIRLANLLGDNNNQKASIYVFDNTITHQQSSSEYGAGIRLENVVQSSVVDNDISHPTSATNWWETAIRSTSGSNGNGFYCNYIHHIGNGILFDGYQTTNTTVANNDFEVNHRAFMLNWGDVGPQPNGTGIPHDNEWIDPSYWDVTNYKYTTQVLGTHTHSTSFDVRTAAPSVYYPNANNVYDLGGYPIPLSVIGNSWQYGCVVNGLHANFKTDGSEKVTEQPDYLSITDPVVAQSEREANQQWLAKYGLFDRLTHDGELLASTSELGNFFAETATANMGRLHAAVSAFQAARRGQAEGAEGVLTLQQLQPVNSVEQTLVDVLSILYAHATDLANLGEAETARLREIAKRCPLDDGFGVYFARAALLKVDTLPRHYANECELVRPTDDERNKTEAMSEDGRFLVYPNPNNGTMTIEYELNEGEGGNIRVFDLTGRSIFDKALRSRTSITQINLNDIPSGMYLLQIDVDGDVKLSQRISVIR